MKTLSATRQDVFCSLFQQKQNVTVKRTKPEEELFYSANKFCEERYREHKEILLENEHFAEFPDYYYVALQGGKIVGTTGLFHRLQKKLPIEKQYFKQTLPNFGDSDYELGRFSIDCHHGEEIKTLAIAAIFKELLSVALIQCHKQFFIEAKTYLVRHIHKATKCSVFLKLPQPDFELDYIPKLNWNAIPHSKINYYKDSKHPVYIWIAKPELITTPIEGGKYLKKRNLIHSV